jgi:hypothetical protein
MSTTPFPGPYPTTIAHILVHHITTPVAPERARSAGQIPRGRPTTQQGRSLAILGRAAKHLAGSQLYLNAGASSPGDVEAGQILMRLSREVLADCRAATPAQRRLKFRLFGLLTAKPRPSLSHTA